MNDVEKLHEERATAEKFVEDNLKDLCREMVTFDETGLFGSGKLADLRKMTAYAGASAQSLALGMVEVAAIRAVAGS